MATAAQTKVYTIPGMHTVNDAAGILGVSTARILQLIYAGELKAQRTAGNAYLITADGLQTYKLIRQGNGRPWKPSVAWAALWKLSGLKADWLTYQQCRRLKLHLQGISAEELVWLVRRRAASQAVRVSPSFIDGLKACVALSGASSKYLRGLGLTERSDLVEGYINLGSYDDLKRRFYLVEDGDSNAVIHLTDDCPFGLDALKQMPEAVALVDLAASTGNRERSAALAQIEELLNEQS